MQTVILSLDQSLTHTGYACIASDGTNWYWFETGIIKPKQKGIHRLQFIQFELKQIISRLQPVFLSRELHNHAIMGNANGLHELNGVIDLLAYDFRYIESNSYSRIPSGMWKKYCLGKGNISKDTSYMMKINSCIQSSLDFVKDPKCIVQNITDDNIGDAVCMALTTIAIQKKKSGKFKGTKIQEDSLKDYQKCISYGDE